MHRVQGSAIRNGQTTLQSTIKFPPFPSTNSSKPICPTVQISLNIPYPHLHTAQILQSRHPSRVQTPQSSVQTPPFPSRDAHPSLKYRPLSAVSPPSPDQMQWHSSPGLCHMTRVGRNASCGYELPLSRAASGNSLGLLWLP